MTKTAAWVAETEMHCPPVLEAGVPGLGALVSSLVSVLNVQTATSPLCPRVVFAQCAGVLRVSVCPDVLF